VSVLVSYMIRCGRHSFGHSRYLSDCNTIQLSIHFALRKVLIDYVVVVAKYYEMVCQHVQAYEGTLHSLP
jgi:hypothetical protein